MTTPLPGQTATIQQIAAQYAPSDEIDDAVQRGLFGNAVPSGNSPDPVVAQPGGGTPGSMPEPSPAVTPATPVQPPSTPQATKLQGSPAIPDEDPLSSALNENMANEMGASNAYLPEFWIGLQNISHVLSLFSNPSSPPAKTPLGSSFSPAGQSGIGWPQSGPFQGPQTTPLGLPALPASQLPSLNSHAPPLRTSFCQNATKMACFCWCH